MVQSRGLRQGDPISPYLFTICTEGLTSLLHEVEKEKRIHAVSICSRAQAISHLLFADDSFVFTRASVEEAAVLKHILDAYEKASGQQVNLAKSGIRFSDNISEQERLGITTILGIKEVMDHGFYLGMPSKVKRRKIDSFSFVKEKVQSRVKGWSKVYLSQAGREVLIKPVAQSVSTYAMGVVRISKDLCDGIEKCFNKFFWDTIKDRNGIHWKRWERLTRSKKEGGLGFRSMEEFNSALLAKQAWRLITCPGSLVARLLKTKYFPRKSLLEARVDDKGSPSYYWRSIMSVTPLLKESLVRRIGSGKDIQIWRDPWLPSAPHFIRLERPAECTIWYVSELIDPIHRVWNFELTTSLFSDEEVTQIMQIPLTINERPDGWKWIHTSHGDYTTKSGHHVARGLKYRAMVPQYLTADDWKAFWNLKISEKIKIFCWRVIVNCLPVKARL